MVLEPVHCPECNSINIVKHGKSAAGKQRYAMCNLIFSNKLLKLKRVMTVAIKPKAKRVSEDFAVNSTG
jgi:transposase-like protein